MIIDMHTHLFPDKIAPKAVGVLAKDAALVGMKPNTDGTRDGILESMKKGEVDISVVLPVVTSVSQFDSINRFAHSVNNIDEGIISFGGIHPKDKDIYSHLKYIHDLGLKGVKVHPDYQDTFFDDEGMHDIIKGCFDMGLVFVTHAGYDPAFSEVHCPPQLARDVLTRVYEETHFTEPFVVFAHLGGMQMYDDVEKFLVGTNSYFDISHALEFCPNEQLIRIIKKHGADRILFATDSPWRDQKDYVEKFRSLKGISDNEKEMIFSGNAKRLLSI